MTFSQFSVLTNTLPKTRGSAEGLQSTPLLIMGRLVGGRVGYFVNGGPPGKYSPGDVMNTYWLLFVSLYVLRSINNKSKLCGTIDVLAQTTKNWVTEDLGDFVLNLRISERGFLLQPLMNVAIVTSTKFKKMNEVSVNLLRYRNTLGEVMHLPLVLLRRRPPQMSPHWPHRPHLLSWLPVSFLLHVKYPLSYRIVRHLS